MISSRRRYGYALESYPLIPLANSGRSRKKRYTFFFRITDETEETQKKKEERRRIEDTSSPRRVFVLDDANEPAAREEAYFARGLLAEDRRSHYTREGPPRAAP